MSDGLVLVAYWFLLGVALVAFFNIIKANKQ